MPPREDVEAAQANEPGCILKCNDAFSSGIRVDGLYSLHVLNEFLPTDSIARAMLATVYRLIVVTLAPKARKLSISKDRLATYPNSPLFARNAAVMKETRGLC